MASLVWRFVSDGVIYGKVQAIDSHSSMRPALKYDEEDLLSGVSVKSMEVKYPPV